MLTKASDSSALDERHTRVRRRDNHVARAVKLLVVLSISAGIAACFAATPPQAALSAQRPAGISPTLTKPDADLLQLMRGEMFAHSNVIFAGQMDVGTIPHDALPAVSPNPLTSVYGGWQAVENSSLALAESARLLIIPGRTCANGKAVPAEDAAWVNYVNAMHAAALSAYKAAQTKDTSEMAKAAENVSDSCAACHNVYRSNRAGFAARCMASLP